MGLSIKLFTALLILGAAGLFVLKKPDGTPWISINDFLPDQKTIQSISASIEKTTPKANTQADQAGGIYRWKDANGQWQFSDTPPEGQTAEKINVSGNLNKDLAEKAALKTQIKPKTATSTGNIAGSAIGPTTISPGQISKLMEDAGNIQQVIDGRETQLNKQLEK